MSRATVPLRARLVRNPRVVVGGLVLLLLLVCAMFAPWLAPHDPLEQDFLAPMQAPAWSAGAPPTEAGKAPYWLGTDNLGRDVLSRLIWGARTALIVAVAATLLAALFAVFSVRLAVQSYLFADISTGNDATPLWIPQLAMAVGTVILFIAFADELVLEWRGRRPPAHAADATHHE